MAEGEHEALIIVRRHDDEEHEAHSSAWKVAHADFMTAMMAFFLIMWLINVTDEEIRKGISEYFNPVHLSQGQSEQKGLNRPDDPSTKETSEKGPSTLARQAEEGDKTDVGNAATPAEENAEAKSEEQGTIGPAGTGTLPNQGTGASPVAGQPPGEAAERAAFQDPYATLAKLANAYDADHPANSDFVVGDDREPGMPAGEVDRDPFDPVYWQLSRGAPVRSSNPGDGAASKRPDVIESRPDSMSALADASQQLAGTTPPAAPPPSAPAPQAPPPSMLAPQAPALPEPKTTPPVAAESPMIEEAPAEQPGSTAETAAAVGAAIERAIRSDFGTSSIPDITVKATAEGVLIDLTDAADFSMFDIGSAIPNGKLVKIMEKVAGILQEQTGGIVVRGHTDGRPFRSDVYDNWRLSAARAHMAYYMLVRGGLAEQRFEKIEGYADRELKNPREPYSDANRRIEILLVKAAP